MERRLTTVLAADVVGYSRLVGEDEEGTLRTLSAYRGFIDGLVADHRGRVFGSAGDSVVVEFASPVEAVRCAVEVQRELGKRNNELPDNRRMKFRIGINLGDVVVDGENLLGDAVNVAARLQELADTGGICISDDVHRQVEWKIDLSFADLGEHELKNIVRPVRVWRYSGPVEASKGAADSALAHPIKPSIAVLPFTNMSGDPGQEYFSDGITEDVITALARCRGLLVVSRNSTFAYKGKLTDVRRIADELSAKYVLEGSVRRSGDRVRVTAQLIDGRNGKNIWVERYERNLDDIFQLQDEIAGVIAGTIEPELGMIEGAALRGRLTVDLNAWDCHQRGLWHLYRFTTDELEMAKKFFERAIALDASFAQAYARLAYVHIQFFFYGTWESRAERVREALSLAERAVELDNKNPAGRLSLGRALTLAGALDRGIEELRTAIELNPSYAQAHFALGQALLYKVQSDEALRAIDEAVRLSPRDPHLWAFFNIRAAANYQASNFDQAETDARTAMRQPNTTHWPLLNLMAILGRQGRVEDAKEALALLQSFCPGFTCADARRQFYVGDRPYMPESYIEQLVVDVREAGLPG